MSGLFHRSILTPAQGVYEGVGVDACWGQVAAARMKPERAMAGAAGPAGSVPLNEITHTIPEEPVRGKEECWPLRGGFFEVSNSKATVLADAVSVAKG